MPHLRYGRTVNAGQIHLSYSRKGSLLFTSRCGRNLVAEVKTPSESDLCKSCRNDRSYSSAVQASFDFGDMLK